MRLARSASLVAGMMLLGTGCGGPSPEERFAQRVCSTTVPFARQLFDAYEDVRLTRPSPGRESRAKLWQDFFEGKQIAARFASRLRALNAPDTNGGREAEKFLDTYAALALERMHREERWLRGLPNNITHLQSTRGLKRVERAFIYAVLEMKAVPGPIRQFIPTLREAFEEAGSCKELEAVGQD